MIINREKGFTLVELMASLGILALTIAIAVPIVGGVMDNAEKDVDVLTIDLIEVAGKIAHRSNEPFDTDIGVSEAYTVSHLINAGYLSMTTIDDNLNNRYSYVSKGTNNKFNFNQKPIPNPDSDFTWAVLEDHVILIDYVGDSSKVIIPDMYEGKPVTVIGRGLPDNYTTYDETKDNIESKDFKAFSKREDDEVVVREVTIPHTVTHIEDFAFMNADLSEIIIPKSVESIGDYAFRSNRLNEVIIPDSVISIGEGTFMNAGLTSIDIPKNVVHIDKYAFYNNSLSSFNYPEPLRLIGDGAFANNDIGSIDYPKKSINLGINVFSDNKITTLDIPDDITHIPRGTFRNNELSELDIPRYVTGIGESAFENNSLERVTISSRNKIDRIEKATFKDNSIKTLHLSTSMKYIDADAFKNNELAVLDFPSSIRYIGEHSFENNKLKDISFPTFLKDIEDGAFYHNGLDSAKLYGRLTSLEDPFSKGNDNMVVYGYLVAKSHTYSKDYGFAFKRVDLFDIDL